MDSPEPPTEEQVFAHFGLRLKPKQFTLERSIEQVEVKDTIGQVLEAWLKAGKCRVVVMSDDMETQVAYLSSDGIRASFDAFLKERGL